MDLLDKNIGSAKDNMNSPIHNWYKFTAGFSYKFVDAILDDADKSMPLSVFEPFAGCGTTLVASQKHKIRAIGNESQEFMCRVINAKLNWDIDDYLYDTYLLLIQSFIKEHKVENIEDQIHPLLKTLYEEQCLKKLYLIRNAITSIDNEKYRLFFNLALSQTLHKVAMHPIAVPYISRAKRLANLGDAWTKFSNISKQMLLDLQSFDNLKRTSEVYWHDSRLKNDLIEDSSCNICITSPPYLNNLDYGEVAKVHTHFFEITSNWNDITTIVRQHLVTGSTTHYRNSDFSLSDFRLNEFSTNNKSTFLLLEEKFNQIRLNAIQRNGKKTFNILMMHYFEDMFLVLKELRRVLSYGSQAYLILGDSAPYGVYIPTTQYLGEIAKSVGFDEYEIYKIRTRGNKWPSLKNRHDIELSENILILK